jgi:hypothetical protein
MSEKRLSQTEPDKTPFPSSEAVIHKQPTPFHNPQVPEEGSKAEYLRLQKQCFFIPRASKIFGGKSEGNSP